MFSQLFDSVGVWFSQVRRIAFDAFIDLEPREYFMLLVVTIAVGWVMLKGRN